MSATNNDTSESRSAFGAGFDLHPIQLRAATATPSKWRDALVASVSPNGCVVVRDPFDNAETRLWNHADNTSTLCVGDPIVWHPLYGVLGSGDVYMSVAVLSV